MCFEEGGHPDWDRHAELFAQSARLVRVNDDGVFEFDLQSFRRDLERMISSGALRAFWEGEISRETRRFGDVAHVLSCYETRSSRDGEPLGLQKHPALSAKRALADQRHAVASRGIEPEAVKSTVTSLLGTAAMNAHSRPFLRSHSC
jgi:hypothetical protein